MANCPKCGAALPDGARFCSSCGSLTGFSSAPQNRNLPQARSDAFRDSRDYRAGEYNAFNSGRGASPRGRSFGSDPYGRSGGSARRSYDPGDPFGTAAKDRSRRYDSRYDPRYDSGSAFGGSYHGYGDPYAGGGSSKKKIILISSISAAAVALIVILLVVLLGGGGPGKSPAATVKSFAKAMTDLDVDGMAKCIVPEMRTGMDEAKAEFSQIKSMVSGFSVKVKDLQDPIYNPEKTGCTLNGTMTVAGTMGGVSITGASGSGSMDMPVTFELEKIDGKWLISDMGGMESLF